MTFLEAAIEVLRQVGRPLHVHELTERAVKLNLLSHTGRAPESTMQSRLAQELKKGERTPLVQKGPGLFGLRQYERPERPKAAPTPRGRREDSTGEANEAADAGTAPADASKRRRRRRGGRGRKGSDATMDAAAMATGSVEEGTPEEAMEAQRLAEEHEPESAPAQTGAAAPAVDAIDLDALTPLTPRRYPRVVDLPSEEALAAEYADEVADGAGVTAPLEGEIVDAQTADEDRPLLAEIKEERERGRGHRRGERERGGRKERRRGREGKPKPVGASLPGDVPAKPANPVVREPAVREPAVREPAVREPAVREPVDGRRQPAPRNRRPEADSAHRRPEADSAHRRPEADSAHRRPEADSGHRRPEADSGHRRPEADSGHRRPEADSAHRRPEPEPLVSAGGVAAPGHSVGNVAEIALGLLRSLNEPRPVHARQLAAMAVKRKLLIGDVEDLWRTIRTALVGDSRERQAAGLRPRARHQGGGLFLLMAARLDAETRSAEDGLERAAEELHRRTHEALRARLARVSANGLVELATIFLEHLGHRDFERVKRNGETWYVIANRQHGSRVDRILVAVRAGGGEINRNAVGELRAGVVAKGCAEGLILCAGRLGADGARELEADGPPITVVAGDDLAGELAWHGVGVIRTTLPISYLDLEFLGELGEG